MGPESTESRALCPYCSQIIETLSLHVVVGYAGIQMHRCVLYACGKCSKTINAITDPISIREDLSKVIREEKYANVVMQTIQGQGKLD